jgi:hypothetical protein
MIKLTLSVALLLLATPPALATTDRPLARVDDHGRQAVRRPPPAAQPAAAPAPAAERGADGWVSIGPYGGIVSALAASPSVGGLVLVALDSPGGNSLYRSTDGGQGWQPVQAIGGLGVQAIAFAADGTAYLATGFHLRASTDGGLNWTTVTNPFSSSISEVAIDPGTGDLWLGIGSALGGSTFVIQSTDGVATLDGAVEHRHLRLRARKEFPADVDEDRFVARIGQRTHARDRMTAAAPSASPDGAVAPVTSVSGRS